MLGPRSFTIPDPFASLCVDVNCKTKEGGIMYFMCTYITYRNRHRKKKRHRYTCVHTHTYPLNSGEASQVFRAGRAPEKGRDLSNTTAYQ